MLHDPLNDYDAIGQVLIKAGRRLQEHGPCKGVLEDLHGRTCLLGAINIAITGIESHFNPLPFFTINGLEISRKCHQALKAKLKDLNIWSDLVPWNNAPERKAEEVIDLLYQTAEDHKLVKV